MGQQDIWFLRVRADELLHGLLFKAREGLLRLGVDATEAAQWLSVIEGRLFRRQTGAIWQKRWVERHGADMQAMTLAYLECQESGLPVHEWPM